LALSVLAAATAATVLAAPAGALAAQHCAEPGDADWTDATPAAAGMDAAKLEDAIDYATTNQAQAVRVYRYGCRVAEDRLGPVNRRTTFQSWSMAKSITAMIFGRAMTQNLVGPDDPLGSLVPVADAAHGRITMRELLTMTSGLQWNGLRDYNIFMPDRIHEALTVPVDKQPGTYWEYSQSGPALVAEATQAAVGEDFQAYAQRALLGPLGIETGSGCSRSDSCARRSRRSPRTAATAGSSGSTPRSRA
jgi:CubicO group peptidase (beta-lactamase class C family)